MIDRITSHWWVYLLRGILALAAGLLALVYPGAAILAVTLIFGAYAFIDGILAVTAAVRMNHADHNWIWLLVEGVLGIAVGIYVVIFPGAAALVLALLLGAWALVTGVLAIGSAVALRRWVPGEWWMLLTAIVSIVFGVAALLNIAVGLLGIAYIFAWYAIIAGVVFLGLSFRLRNLRQTAPA